MAANYLPVREVNVRLEMEMEMDGVATRNIIPSWKLKASPRYLYILGEGIYDIWGSMCERGRDFVIGHRSVH